MDGSLDIENEKEINYSVSLSLLKWELIPDINLYSEQVVQIINDSLKDNVILGKKIDFTKSFITPSMINNYVKLELISSPENKRYSREQIAKLIVISLLKQVYSTEDIIKFFKITHDTAPIPRAYTSFVTLLTEAIANVFIEGEKTGNNESSLRFEDVIEDQFVIETKEQSLLKNVTISVANRIYVQEYLARLNG